MRKLDVVLAALIGFINGLFFFFILKQIIIKIPFAWLLPVILAFLCAFGLFIASLIGEKIKAIFQLAKFVLVGTLNTFIDIGVLNLLISLTKTAKGGPYIVFKTISFLGATTNSYFWNKYWTFEKGGEKATSKEFIKFLIVTTMGLGINVGTASLLVNVMGPQFGLNEKIWGGVIGPIVAAFVTFVWNFLASKFIVFLK